MTLLCDAVTLVVTLLLRAASHRESRGLPRFFDDLAQFVTLVTLFGSLLELEEKKGGEGPPLRASLFFSRTQEFAQKQRHKRHIVTP
ncbi:hypothetical protein ACFQS7_29680 [Dankookia sp. GCM10030260]|uniref:hypothetical protein n=1 Tax=Dankookia sp. GCM10030260 TaxID=3273390 RepID=UPI003606FD4A